MKSLLSIIVLALFLTPLASASVLLTSCPDGFGHPPATHMLHAGNATIEYTVIAANKTDPCSVQFKDLSKGVENYIRWDFGDGTFLESKPKQVITSALRNPVHKFKKVGYYIPNFTIRCNGSSSKMWYHVQIWIKK